jgi:hypothetical protein
MATAIQPPGRDPPGDRNPFKKPDLPLEKPDVPVDGFKICSRCHAKKQLAEFRGKRGNKPTTTCQQCRESVSSRKDARKRLQTAADLSSPSSMQPTALSAARYIPICPAGGPSSQQPPSDDRRPSLASTPGTLTRHETPIHREMEKQRLDCPSMPRTLVYSYASIKIKHSNFRYMCPLCSKSYHSIAGYNSHYSAIHVCSKPGGA